MLMSDVSEDDVNDEGNDEGREGNADDFVDV